MKKDVIRVASAVALCVLAFAWVHALAPPADRSYVWFAEFVALDPSAKTVTVKAQVQEHVPKYIGQFKPGDRIMLIWNMIDKLQADTVLYVSRFDAMKTSKVDTGYILPAELIATEAAPPTITFKATVPDGALQALKSAQPGKWIKVTAPMTQAAETAAITTIEITDKPKPESLEKPKPPAAETAKPSEPKK